MTASALRTGRLFRRDTGRTLMVALDRTLLAGPCPHAEDAAALVARFADSPVEALLLSPGLTRLAAGALGHATAPRIVTRIDYPLVADFAYHGAERHEMICTPEAAAALGADAVVMCLVSGYADVHTHGANLRAVGKAAESCARIGLPLVVEAVLWGERHDDPRDAEALARICRIAAELGADVVKTQPPATVEGLRLVVEACPVPVTALGGAATDADAAARLAELAIDGGARGLVFGRNIWARPEAQAFCATLSDLVHRS
ncbi:class I fructose-bisphosphate aldolase [Tropicimonas sp. IMCC34043]|uniref:class I fructose-bisphosphate aldolase n=1 Tax=Tropicimonas sp. IMCC34043 TaxID=2248760 RepID=UPI001300B725|nr:hypothetical protein [Tropicimonas sp. IMCC34043]